MLLNLSSLALSLCNPRSAFRKLLNFFNQPCSDSTFQSFNGTLFFFNKMSSPTTCDQIRLDLSSLILAIRSFRFSKFSIDEQHAMNMIFLEIFYQFRSISSLFSKLHNLITFHQIRTLVNGIPSNGSKNGSLRDPCSKEDKQA